MEKVVRGILFGALTPVGVAFSLTIIWSLLQAGATPSFILIAVVFAVVMAAIVSAISTPVLGVPTYLLFERLRIRSAKAYLVWGTIISIVLAFFLFIQPARKTLHREARAYWFFWLHLFQGRPLHLFSGKLYARTFMRKTS